LRELLRAAAPLACNQRFLFFAGRLPLGYPVRQLHGFQRVLDTFLRWRTPPPAPSLSSSDGRSADTPVVPYGSTLLVAVIAACWLVCAQIGDGDMLAVRPDGSSFSPVPGDDRLDGRRTTSLCQPDALASFRTGAHDLRQVPLAALLLATDGYCNAQADEPWQPRVGRDLAELAACRDRRWFGPEVPGWAQRCASVEGSGDDATIALVLPGDAEEKRMYRGGHM